MQDQVSSNGGERGCMSGTCDILDTTLGGQEHTLAGQELAGTYWVTLKISSSIYFVSVTDGGRRLENGFSSETESVLQTDQQYKAEGKCLCRSSFTSVYLLHQPDNVYPKDFRPLSFRGH